MINQRIREMYEPTIGIECHVQLKTKTKLFSGADNDARESEPNTTVSPICFGLPGTLPVLNTQAVVLAIRAGIALNAEIALESSFDRKHYFYPDLPKGYQITQLERPIVGTGKVEVPLGDGSFTVRITRAHLEEDAGKLTHPEGADYSLVDLNRAGTPLIEIVSEADIHSAAEAKAYAQELYLLMKYADVTEGDLYHGNMRFDVNISVAKKGAEWGTRVEVKNLNSFRSVERAAEYEFNRQIELLEKGQAIVQETRGWDDAKQRTFSQRSKENAHDYRYFPDADVPPLQLTEYDIQISRDDMPPLPPQLRLDFSTYNIDKTTANTLITQYALYGDGYLSNPLAVGDIAGADAARFTANFLANRFAGRRVNEPDLPMPAAHHFLKTFELVKNSELSSNGADKLLFLLAHHDQNVDVRELAASEGLLQENDMSALEAIVTEVLAEPASAKAIEDIKAGNDKAIGYLVGQVMKLSRGKANPAMVSQLIKERLK